MGGGDKQFLGFLIVIGVMLALLAIVIFPRREQVAAPPPMTGAPPASTPQGK